MLGIVLVSHSRQLAEAAVALAREMVRENFPPLAVAAGAGEGVTGTDAVKVAAAITQVAGPEGVLVLMDLGSAVLSAELALEFVAGVPGEVRLSSAPFVEGLLAAVVRAAGGASLDEVDREATGALAAKRGQLGHSAPAPGPAITPTVAPALASSGERLVLTNPEGMHARPAALIVAALRGIDAKVTLATDTKGPVDARSPIGLMTLGARTGDAVILSAEGPEAQRALAAVRELVLDAFGENG